MNDHNSNNPEVKSIHDFDFSLICEYYAAVERQGPGSPEVTKQALAFIDNLTEKSKIADIGSGTGGQTITLAQNAPGNITAVDLFPDFIDKLNRNAEDAGLAGRIKGIVGNMDNLPFAEEELDLIWSEGAIYNIGFQRGLNEWKKFVKPGGYMAVSEVSWLTPQRPTEIEEFWNDAYPEIDTIPVKTEQMQGAGFVPVAHFILPVGSWTEHFYAPQHAVREEFLKKHAGNGFAADFIANQRHEESLFNKYNDYYGYVFYIGQKPAF